VDIEKPSELGTDKYSSLHWGKKEDLISYLCNHFSISDRIPVSCYWFEEMVVFNI